MRQAKTNRTMILTAAAMTACAGMGVSSTMGANIRPWQGTTINWTGATNSNWNDAGNWTSVANVKLQQVDGNGDLVYTNPPTNMTPIWGPNTTTATIPGNDQAIGNTPIIQNASTNTRPYDTAQFGTTSQHAVSVDSGRFVSSMNFTGSASDSYTFSGSKLNVIGGTIGGDKASTITFNNDINFRGDYNVNPGAGQTFNFVGTVYQNSGRSFQIGSGNAGTINFNVIGGLGSEVAGGTNGDPTSGNAVNIRFLGGGATTVNLGADNKAVDGRVNITFDANNTKGTVNLNHANAVYSDTPRGAAGVTLNNGGTVNVNAANAIGGTNAFVNVGTHSSDTATTLSLMTVDYGQSYGGATTVGKTYVLNQARTANQSLLLVNNATGSGTGASDITVRTGTLGGDGYIVNTGVKGATFQSHAVLSPGASANASGTLTFDLGSKGLDLSSSVADANTQSLLFDLVAPGSSDKVNLLNNTTLHIGTGGLEWDDFAFATTGSIPAGTYTLFSSATNAIDGTLGANVSGVLDGHNFHLDFANGGKDLILTTVPEPATLGLLAIGGLGLLARRRRV